MGDDPCPVDSCRCEVGAGGIRGPIRLLDARPDRRTRQIIPSEKQSGNARRQSFERLDDFDMAQVVLGQSACITKDVCRYWFLLYSEDASHFAANYLRDFAVAQVAQSRIGGASGEAGKAHHSVRCASWKERGAKDRAENSKPFASRHENSEAVHCLLKLFAAIARGNH